MSTHRLLWKLLCLEGLSRNFWDKQESSWILILLLFVVIVGSYQSAAGLISPGEEMWFRAANGHTCPVFFTICWIWNFIRFCWWGLPCTCKLPVSCIGWAGYCIFYVNTVNRSYCFSGESKKFCFCSVCGGIWLEADYNVSGRRVYNFLFLDLKHFSRMICFLWHLIFTFGVILHLKDSAQKSVNIYLHTIKKLFVNKHFLS